MARPHSKILLYEVLGKSRTRPVYEKLTPKAAAPVYSASASNVIAAPQPVPDSSENSCICRPKGRRITLSVSYYLVIAILFAGVLIPLIAFRIGQTIAMTSGGVKTKVTSVSQAVRLPAPVVKAAAALAAPWQMPYVVDSTALAPVALQMPPAVENTTPPPKAQPQLPVGAANMTPAPPAAPQTPAAASGTAAPPTMPPAVVGNTVRAQTPPAQVPDAAANTAKAPAAPQIAAAAANAITASIVRQIVTAVANTIQAPVANLQLADNSSSLESSIIEVENLRSSIRRFRQDYQVLAERNARAVERFDEELKRLTAKDEAVW